MDAPAVLTLEALGVRLDLRVEHAADTDFLDAVRAAWGRCLAPAPTSSTKDARAEAGPLEVAHPGRDPEATRAALQRLSSDVTLRLVTAQTGRLLMLHAGAVSHPVTGRSVVFVAPSGTGKTTLATTLGARYGYLTDETVGIEPDTGRIHPYPKPLSILTGPSHRKVETSPDDLGLLPAHPAPILAALLILNRDPALEGPRVRTLGTLDAVAAIVPQSSALNRLPRPLNSAAELFERSGPTLEVGYAEAAGLIPLIDELIGAAP